MTPRLLDARVVVTGASRGLGRAVAEAMWGEGAVVVATARDTARLGALERATGGGRLHAVGLDLGDVATVDRAVAGIVATLGGVDVLVNNAGTLGERGPLADASMDLLCDTLQTNVCGTLRLTTGLLPVMGHGAAIINVTSGASGRAGWGGYALAKLAIDGATHMLREELAGRGVRVVAVNPGGLRTQMRAAAYPSEDPATVPHPRNVVEPFLAVAAGADPGPRVEAQQWPS